MRFFFALFRQSNIFFGFGIYLDFRNETDYSPFVLLPTAEVFGKKSCTVAPPSLLAVLRCSVSSIPFSEDDMFFWELFSQSGISIAGISLS